ncbi:Hypothetical predicted protein, partial [Marmota monax]
MSPQAVPGNGLTPSYWAVTRHCCLWTHWKPGPGVGRGSVSRAFCEGLSYCVTTGTTTVVDPAAKTPRTKDVLSSPPCGQQGPPLESPHRGPSISAHQPEPGHSRSPPAGGFGGFEVTAQPHRALCLGLQQLLHRARHPQQKQSQLSTPRARGLQPHPGLNQWAAPTKLPQQGPPEIFASERA